MALNLTAQQPTNPSRGNIFAPNFTLPQRANLPNTAIDGSNLNIGSQGFNDPNAGRSLVPNPLQNINSNFDAANPVPGASGGIPGIDFFDAKGGSRFLIPGLEALTGVGNAFLAKEQLDLGRDQFNFARDTNVRDFNAQAQTFNTNLENAKRNNLVASGGFDTSTPEGQAQFDSALEAYVKENSIQSA